MNSAASNPLAADQRISAPADSVSFVVRHRVRAGAHTAYEAWLVETMRVAAGFPGHQGVQVVRPAAGGVDYTIIVNFASHDDATRWHQSAERAPDRGRAASSGGRRTGQRWRRHRLLVPARVLYSRRAAGEATGLEAVADHHLGDLAADHGGAVGV
ncbi:antibiotic biosynthesis monooxygenase [Polaromonas sp. P1(28)-13]|nr:antibiotic biosynthesis monooxygenase [Polaromonas sp. P1(28)-13]